MDNLFRREIDIQTGEETIIPLTPEEIAALQAVAAQQPEPTLLTPAEKLERAGLTVEELKGLLGL